MLNSILTNIGNFFWNLLDYLFFYSFFIIFTPLGYFSTDFKEYIKFSNIPIPLRILFLILYVLLYIFSSKKHKKYVLISFIILWLCFAFFISPKYAI